MRTSLVLFPILLSACAGMKEAAVKDAMDEIWNKGDLSIIDEAYEPELAHEVKRFVRENRELYPDIKVTIVDSVIKGNRYVTRWEVQGTHKDLDKPVTLEGVSVRTRTGGVFVEEGMYYDMKQVFDQLGFRVSPPEGTSPFGGVKAAAVKGEEAAATADELPAWPEGVGEAFTADKVALAVASAAKVADAKAGEADCERYPCVVVLDLASKTYADGLAKTTTELDKSGLADAWHWPVVKGDRYHAVMVFPAGPLDPARASELRERMHAKVAALLEDAG